MLFYKVSHVLLYAIAQYYCRTLLLSNCFYYEHPIKACGLIDLIDALFH